MRITNVGFNHFHDADFFINRPEGSGDYLMLLLKTPGIFVLNGVEEYAPAFSAILYKKGTPQFYRAEGQQFGNDWFHFLPDTEEDERFLNAMGVEFDRLYDLDSISELSVFVSMMCHENYSSNLFKTDSVDLLIKLFLIKFSEKINMSDSLSSGTWYERMSILRTKIYNDPAHYWNIDGMAHELAISRSTFQHIYKKMFGVTAMSDVIVSRIERGKYLLATTDFSVTHIAQLCGYSTDIHFMRQFKQQTGLTPSEFRVQAISKDNTD